jgi:hypothetical protein
VKAKFLIEMSATWLNAMQVETFSLPFRRKNVLFAQQPTISEFFILCASHRAEGNAIKN